MSSKKKRKPVSPSRRTKQQWAELRKAWKRQPQLHGQEGVYLDGPKNDAQERAMSAEIASAAAQLREENNRLKAGMLREKEQGCKVIDTEGLRKPDEREVI